MFHIELRKFPHTVCRYNQSEEQLQALVVPWVREEWIEEGERQWNMHEAGLTVLEGPQLSMADLSMGRGWRNAQRRSQDVTEGVLAQAKEAQTAEGSQLGGEGAGAAAAQTHAEAGVGDQDAPRAPTGGGELLADSLGLELLGRLDQEAVAPSEVWRMAHARLGTRPPGESLALAEAALRSLLVRGLVALLGGSRQRDGQVARSGAGEALAGQQQETILGDLRTWTGGGPGSVRIARRS